MLNTKINQFLMWTVDNIQLSTVSCQSSDVIFYKLHIFKADSNYFNVKKHLKIATHATAHMFEIVNIKIIRQPQCL